MRKLPRTAAADHASRTEPFKRLSVNLPERLHTRFRTACIATRRQMIPEIRKFVERRTLELEGEIREEARQWGELESAAAGGGVPKPEPVKRLSVNVPESLRTRFRTACSATNRKMIPEIRVFVERRTAELEEEAGLLIDRRWGSPESDRARKRREALIRALGRNHPTADIGEMLADIARGHDLR